MPEEPVVAAEVLRVVKVVMATQVLLRQAQVQVEAKVVDIPATAVAVVAVVTELPEVQEIQGQAVRVAQEVAEAHTEQQH
jgi:hypothetical protein